MALPWVDFVWTIKRWISLYPLSFVTSLPKGTPAAGNYTITANDYSLVSTNNSDATWTLPAPSGEGQVLKIKHKGTGTLTISGTIFLYEQVASLEMVTGDMVTLSDDGTDWNVGD